MTRGMVIVLLRQQLQFLAPDHQRHDTSLRLALDAGYRVRALLIQPEETTARREEPNPIAVSLRDEFADQSDRSYMGKCYILVRETSQSICTYERNICCLHVE